jgi:uracil-DNA glycosylase family 4
MSELEALCAQINSCRACGLCETRTHAVPGEGPPNADIMFIGEGPGFHEDQQARPFVGAAGKFLEEMLASIGLRRSEVYITNVLKCRPPGNRDPLPDEVDACRAYLLRQIELIDPKLIVTLGRFSLSWFFPRDSISKVHGSLRRLGSRYFMHLYHPAAALHAGNLRKTIQEDFSRIPSALDKIEEAQHPVFAAVAMAAQDTREQMRLF